MSDKVDFTTLPGNYSISEINTGYTWIDGSAIYKKTVTKSPISNNSPNSVSHGITNLAQAIRYEGMLKAGDNSYTLPRLTHNSLAQSVELEITPSVVNFITGPDASFDSAVATIFYTKTN